MVGLAEAGALVIFFYVAFFAYRFLEWVTRPIPRPDLDEIISRNKDLYDKLGDE